jgi:hypothetical protein
MQEMTLQREGDGAGRLVLDGGHYYTLENPEKQIAAGTYKVVLTKSARAAAGSLYTCWPDFMLPLLVDVRGREGIRIHAANLREQLEGCVAPGTDRTSDRVTLVHSRLALQGLATVLKFPCWITILDPK